jgi:CRP-like cAMP-binding protein
VNEISSQTNGLHVLDRKVFGKGEKIFREGDPGNRAYIVQRGSVDIVKEIAGDNVVVGSVGPGGIFGEMALIDKEPRMASAIVADYCVCIIINAAMFQKKLKSLDPFLGGILRILVENIRSIQDAKQDTQALEAMFASTEVETEAAPEEDGVEGENAFEIA